MSDAVQKIIWIGVSIAAALSVAAIMWTQLSDSSEQIEDTPLVDYAQITNQAICQGAGGTWDDAATPKCKAKGSTTPVKKAANTFTTQDTCEAENYVWNPAEDPDGTPGSGDEVVAHCSET